MTDTQEPKSKRPAGNFVVFALHNAHLLDFTVVCGFITDTAFKQQRLPAWQPILTARNVMPIFFGIAAAFIPIGLGLLYLTNIVSCFCTFTFINLWYLIKCIISTRKSKQKSKWTFFRFKNLILIILTAKWMVHRKLVLKSSVPSLATLVVVVSHLA